MRDRRPKPKSTFEHTKPNVLVCPICSLPGTKKKSPHCTFMVRLGTTGNLRKLHENEDESAKLRTKQLRELHADFCKTCRQPKDVCHEKKVKLAIKKAILAFGSAYDEAGNLKVPVASIACKPLNQKDYNAALPSWWTT